MENLMVKIICKNLPVDERFTGNMIVIIPPVYEKFTSKNLPVKIYW